MDGSELMKKFASNAANLKFSPAKFLILPLISMSSNRESRREFAESSVGFRFNKNQSKRIKICHLQ
jgi:hypothetical protein